MDHSPLDTYIRAVELRARATVCASHDAGFGAEFTRRYEAWQAAHAEALAQGAALAAKKGLDRDTAPGIPAFARMGAQTLDRLPPDDRERQCAALLSSLALPPAR